MQNIICFWAKYGESHYFKHRDLNNEQNENVFKMNNEPQKWITVS